MLTFMLGTIILALTFGALWHSQPARQQEVTTGEAEFGPTSLLNRALHWLLLLPNASNAVEKEKAALANGAATQIFAGKQLYSNVKLRDALMLPRDAVKQGRRISFKEGRTDSRKPITRNPQPEQQSCLLVAAHDSAGVECLQNP